MFSSQVPKFLNMCKKKKNSISKQCFNPLYRTRYNFIAHFFKPCRQYGTGWTIIQRSSQISKKDQMKSFRVRNQAHHFQNCIMNCLQFTCVLNEFSLVVKRIRIKISFLDCSDKLFEHFNSSCMESRKRAAAVWPLQMMLLVMCPVSRCAHGVSVFVAQQC